jgi:hypothetical protein
LGNNRYSNDKQGAKQEDAKADIAERTQSHARQTMRERRFCGNVVHLKLEILEEPWALLLCRLLGILATDLAFCFLLMNPKISYTTSCSPARAARESVTPSPQRTSTGSETADDIRFSYAERPLFSLSEKNITILQSFLTRTSASSSSAYNS